jgi:hypothetical protein
MTLTLPPVPFVADPVRNVIIPLLPVEVVPDVKDSELDIPLTPASADFTLNAPLELVRPYPVIIEIEPPVASVLSPAFTATRPP